MSNTSESMPEASITVNLGFWKKYTRAALDRPAFVLAPMADVTDCAFRKIIAEHGKPDVLWTEFVSADGLVRATPEGKAKLMHDLIFDPSTERPIVAQLFGSKPEYMKQAAQLAAELGFDGVDINMGCPDRSIEKQKAGAAMMKDPKLAQEIIKAAQEGAVRKANTKFGDDAVLVAAGADVYLPVSVKTRIGYNKDELETWLPALLEARPAVITIHARTRKEMSDVPARWEHVKRAVEIRNEFFAKNVGEQIETGETNEELAAQTLIFGNGDIISVSDGFNKAKETGADGVMLGRAIFGNPWLFKNMEKECGGESFEDNTQYKPTTEEKLRVMVLHTKEFEKQLGGIKNFAVMKKHYKAYVNGFDGAKELRLELMENAGTAAEVEGVVDRFIGCGKV